MSEIRANIINSEDGTAAVHFPKGQVVTGVTTATSFAGAGTNLTALNAANLGSGTVPTARLGTGTANNTVHLRGDGTWAAAGGGKILQVVEATTTTNVANNTTSMADSGLSASITPASGSKVLIFVNQNMWQYRNRGSTNNQGGGINILRGSTVIWESKKDSGGVYSDWWVGGISVQNYNFRVSYNMLDDSPGGNGSTAITYKTQFALTYADDSGAMEAQPTDNTINGRSSIILMEVGS